MIRSLVLVAALTVAGCSLFDPGPAGERSIAEAFYDGMKTEAARRPVPNPTNPMDVAWYILAVLGGGGAVAANQWRINKKRNGNGNGTPTVPGQGPENPS